MTVQPAIPHSNRKELCNFGSKGKKYQVSVGRTGLLELSWPPSSLPTFSQWVVRQKEKLAGKLVLCQWCNVTFSKNQ